MQKTNSPFPRPIISEAIHVSIRSLYSKIFFQKFVSEGKYLPHHRLLQKPLGKNPIQEVTTPFFEQNGKKQIRIWGYWYFSPQKKPIVFSFHSNFEHLDQQGKRTKHNPESFFMRAMNENPLTLHYTGCLIGSLRMVYYPHMTG